MSQRGQAGLADRSSRPHQLQTRATDDQRAKVQTLRRTRQPFGRIAASVGVSRATVAQIGKSFGLSHLSALNPRPESIRYEKKTPGEMIHIDIKKLGPHRRHRPPHHWKPHGPKQPMIAQAGRQGVGILGTWPSMTIRAWPISKILPDKTRKYCLTFLFHALHFFRSHGVKV